MDMLLWLRVLLMLEPALLKASAMQLLRPALWRHPQR
jgi:hypothetical protein